ncbi:hypothetical protein HPB48_009557 [Haemaphysalis longicornis]|uniref:Uncharacterized protein n=1 Tax=Haemaphysalis longicornis TaxID=44386 RepID=A0A9J6G0Q6_HAELO|nr:hypothetical protein HPB48_009557 [Haemaphysalis longicornis]
MWTASNLVTGHTRWVPYRRFAEPERGGADAGFGMPEQARAPAAAAGDHDGAEATSAVVASTPGDASRSQQVIGVALRLVSWAAKASQTARAGTQTRGIHIRAKQDNEQEELQSIRAILDQVLAENRQLKAELAQIKRSCTPAKSSAGTPASHFFEENPPRSKRRAEEAADRPSQESHQMEQLEQRFKQRFEELQCAVNSLATASDNFRGGY